MPDDAPVASAPDDAPVASAPVGALPAALRKQLKRVTQPPAGRVWRRASGPARLR